MPAGKNNGAKHVSLNCGMPAPDRLGEQPEYQQEFHLFQTGEWTIQKRI